jgi:hypothetical protein
MQVYVFVDYDNVKLIPKELSDAEAEQNVLAIVDAAASITKSLHNQAGELAIRLYGGWTDIAGMPTERALRLYRVLDRLAKRMQGFRIGLELVVSPILGDEHLVGLWRDGGQKMVDTLMTADVTWCALSIDCPLILMSDDDDMTPAAATAARIVRGNWSRRPLCLSRMRSCGEGMNDRLLENAGVYFGGGL